MYGRFGGIVAATLTVVGIAACGNATHPSMSSSSPSAGASASAVDTSRLGAAEMLARAATYLRKVHAFGLRGEGGSGGSGQLRIDYTFVGEDSGGTLAKGPSYQVRSVNGVRYVKPSEAMWTKLVGPGASTYAARYADDWLRVQPSSGPFWSLTDLADRAAAVDSLFTPRTGVNKTSGTAIVRGVECVGIKARNDGESTLYLAVDDLRPMAVVNTGPDGGRIDFMYEGLRPIEAPPASSVVDAPTVPKLPS